MDTLVQLKAFVATAQTGSFTAAADRLGLSNRLTSKYVAELERRLGTRLFQRTTRTVGLSPAGEELLVRAPALLDDFDDMLAGLSEGARGISGVIRVSAPQTLGEIYVAGMLGRFVDRNPDLTVDLRLSDRFVDLAAEGIDLAFRIGVSETLSLKTRKLGELQKLHVASPAYLARAGMPRTPDDLTRHACIVDTNPRYPRRWLVHFDGAEVVVNVDGRFQVNSARAAGELAAAGHGIAFAPRFALGDLLATGRLVALFDGRSGHPLQVSAVYLEGRRLPRRISALIDFAAADMQAARLL